MIEKVLYKEEYIIHFDTSDSWLQFGVYPICIATHLPTGKISIEYYDKHSSDTHEEFNEDTCRKMFEGSYCWRGVWEGRLYFKDTEYWGEELKEMSEVYDFIEVWCKDFIQKREGRVLEE